MSLNFATLALLTFFGPLSAVFSYAWPYESLCDQLDSCFDTRMTEVVEGVKCDAPERWCEVRPLVMIIR